MTTIAIINQKGGVGKTVTAVNLAAALTRHEKRVLLVDLDPQAHATMHLGVENFDLTAYHLLTKEDVSAADTICSVEPGLDLIPAQIRLASAEVELSTQLGREHILRSKLASTASKYDFIILDCPPSLGVLTINSTCAADEVLIPVDAKFFSLDGLTNYLDVLKVIQERLHQKVRLRGILMTLFDSRQNLAKEVLEAAKTHGPVFQTVIRTNVRLAEAPAHGKHIFDYFPKSSGAEDYASLAEEILS